MVLMPSCVPKHCGKDFRESLRKPSPNLPYEAKKKKGPRFVPAFTLQALQKNTKVVPPPRYDIYNVAHPRKTSLQAAYKRGELPINIMFSNYGKYISWKVPVERLDFHYYLPMLFNGLSETSYPYNFIAESCLRNLCTKGGRKVMPVVPQLIIPIKNALSTKRAHVICQTLACLQLIITRCDNVGKALVPYYRQLLPIFNLFKEKNRTGDSMDASGMYRDSSLYGMIDDTLQILERYGGPDAFVNIKYMVPTYESCIMN